MKEMELLNENLINQGIHLAEFEEEKRLKLELDEIWAREEFFWSQKSREIWLKEGDKNTKFFHKLAMVNKSKRSVVEVKKDDRSLTQSIEEEN